jgi:Glycosyltransferase family 87
MTQRALRYLSILAAMCFASSMLFFVRNIWASPPPPHFSDLYPSWYGARELFFHHRDPYSEAVTREVQIWANGRVIGGNDAQRQDQNRFVYPLYFLFLLAPFTRLSFEQIQEIMRVFLPLLALGTVLLWMRAIQWRVESAWLVVICLLSLTNFPMLESIYLQQPGLFAAAFLAGACASLVSGRMILAGTLLAFSTIKPQLSLIVSLWFMHWSFADWRQRKKLVLSFAISLLALFAASEFLVHGWIHEFIHAVTAYQQYNGTSSLLTLALGRNAWLALAIIGFCVVVSMAWRVRYELATSERFSLMFCTALTYTIVVIPTMYPTAQIILLPAAFLTMKEATEIWSAGRLRRVMFVAVLSSAAWPCIVAGVLFLFQLAIPLERLRQLWIVALAPVLALPSALFLLLVIYGNIPSVSSGKFGSGIAR